VTSCLRRYLAVLLLAAAGAVQASAQEALVPADREIDPSETARFRLGPLRFTPSISLTNLGVDTNVFNESTNPKQDTIGAIGPAANLWMHMGPSLFTGKASVEYLYFDRYESQRAWNQSHRLKWEVPLGRFIPFAIGDYANTKNRTGYEIDSRVRQKDQRVGLGTEMELSGQWRLIMAATRSLLAYDRHESLLAEDLSTSLDRWTNAEKLQLRYRLTPLTTFLVNAEAAQDRFVYDELRNTNSIAVLPGFEMKPSALISGKVNIGFRTFTPLREVIPEYRGPVASVDATFVARATRLGLKVGRDVSYSYQKNLPYYTLTDVMLQLTERLSYTWDVVLQGGRQTLDYAVIRTALLTTDPQVDTIHQYGAGIGYRVGHTVRFGVDGIYFRRRSNAVPLQRDCEGLRIAASATYGLPQ
jgi:Putative beta-barrel porin 2